MVGMLFLLDAPGTEYPSGEPHHTPVGPEFRAGTPTHASASVGSVTPRSDSVPIPVAAPARVADRLAAAPDGPVSVLHACRDTLHLDVAGHAVGVLAAGATGLPHALRSRLPSVSEPESSGVGVSAYLESGTLHLRGRALVIRRLVDVRAPRFDAARGPRTSPVVDEGTPRSPDAGLVALLRRLAHGVDSEGVAALVGRGDGLTPLGDDVLCGWLVAHRAAGVPTPAVDAAVRRALPRTTTLSATLLECALAGEAADPALGYLRALGSPRESAARSLLLELGHSSGAGLAHGIDLAIATMSREVAA
jgi:hypothetical protein